MHIISVPTIFTCKLPNGNWINLAHVRELQPDLTTGVVIVVWLNGDTSKLDGKNAEAIMNFWQQASRKYQ